MKNPKVSIIIPVYNGANYLAEAIDSVLAQTYDNIEIIVVNDGSTDNTEEIIKRYKDKIRYYKKENGGVATALNLAIEKAEGEYISWLSHDDIYYPDKIESQISYLHDQNISRAIIFGDVMLISSSGDKIADKRMSERCIKSLKCLLAIDIKDTLNGCTMLFPKEIFDEFGKFNVDLKYTQDYSMWFNLLKNDVPFIYLDKPLIFSRQHDDQGGRSNPVEATSESDQLHSDLIKQISDDEIDNYCERSLQFLTEIYKTYKINGYLKTSFRLLKHLVRLAVLQKKGGSLRDILNEDIFSFPNSSKTESILNNQIGKYFLQKKSKPRLLIYSNVWTRGGIEIVMSILLNYLVDHYDLILVSTDKIYEGCFSLDPKINHIKISENNGENIAYRLAAISTLLDVDLFIGNPNIIDAFLDVYKLLSELKIKNIACNHGYYFLPYHYKWLHPIIQKRMTAFKHVNAVTWPTSFSANIYRQINGNCAYMPNPNTYDESEKKVSAKGDEKIVLCVGRFYDSVKRLDRALLVFKEVLKKCPEARLVLVGDYDLEMNVPCESNLTFSEFLNNLNIPTQNISFEGEQRHMKGYYEKASLLMLTSDSEGFGIVLIEAGAFGLPCVIFEIPGLEDIIIDGKNGFIVEQNNIHEMAEKINELLEDDDLRFTMGEEARNLVRRFDKNIVCQRWKHLIELVLSGNNQEEINRILSADFSISIDDFPNFMKRVIVEYEKNDRLLLNNADFQAGTF